MQVDVVWARQRSAALFGNEKVIEVVLALSLLDSPATATAQEISRATGIGHPMVRDVLLKLVAGGLLAALPKVGGSRSAQYYQVCSDVLWSDLVGLVTSLNSAVPNARQ